MDSSNFQPPIRRSLSDGELEARVNQAMASRSGVEAVMELLVAQEALKAQEATEEANWVASMQANGSPEAQAALNRYLGVVPANDPEVRPEVAPVVNPEPEAVQPVVEVEPQIVAQPQTFTWLNPSPSTPVVETVVEQAEPAQKPEEQTFSWFSQPEVQEPVIQPEVVPTAVVEDPVVEEAVVELAPVGSESATEFEMLLAAAAAEEELTALEEIESKRIQLLAPTESNVLIPSDEHRNRGPLSQVLVWLGASATAVPLLLVWALIGMGLSAFAVAIVLSVGYLASGLLIALAAIAGKRSGLSTSIISRSAFGVWGNAIPQTVTFVSRIVITAIIIASFTFFMNGSINRLPDFQQSLANFGGIDLTVGLAVQLVLLLVVTLLVVVRGYAARIIQLVMSLLAFALVAESLIAVPAQGLAFTTAGSKNFISMEALAGVALILMVNLTLWFAIAPNLSKAIPMRVRGYKVFSAVLFASFVVPALVGLAAIFWLGSLSVGVGLGTVQEAIAILPGWTIGALTSGTAIAIVFAAMLSARTASLELEALFRLKGRVAATLITFVLTFALLVLFAQQPRTQEVEYLTNVFVLVASLSAGWIGIMAADVSIRRQAYHELSLSRSYGLYKKFNVLSLIIWIITLVAAVALIPVNLLGFGFMGFASSMVLVGISGIAASAIGFVFTVLAGMVLTYVIRIPQIKKQEREVLALESRREQLNDIFVGTE
ncbi:MAG: cytosine permease [Rhodoluna sp.]